MATGFRIKRGTAANLATLAAANGLFASEPYLITDQNRITVGTGVNTHSPHALLSEVNAKQDTLVSGTNIKTINGVSVLGSGNLTVSASAGGSSGEVQFNNGGALGGVANVEVDNGDLVFIANASPVAPPANTVKTFNRQVGGRNMLGMIGPSGLSTPLAPHPGSNRFSTWFAQGNGTGISSGDSAALTIAGTVTTANVATTNLYTSMRRVEALVTTAAVNAIAGWRAPAALWWRGNAANLGGFHLVHRWGNATGAATTTNRCFVGMQGSTAAPTDVEPSTLLNIVGMGWDAADANIQIMHNDGTGTATKINLGASFPVPTTDRSKVYELGLFCAPNSSQITYEVTDLATGASATGTITTDLPVNTTFLAPRMWISSGGTSSVIGISHNSLTIETDY